MLGGAVPWLMFFGDIQPDIILGRRSTLCVLALSNAKTLRKADEFVAFVMCPCHKRRRSIHLLGPTRTQLICGTISHLCSSLIPRHRFLPLAGPGHWLAKPTLRQSFLRVFQDCSSIDHPISVFNLEISVSTWPRSLFNRTTAPAMGPAGTSHWSATCHRPEVFSRG